MNKTVKSVKNSLKFKATPKAGILSVKIGVKKYSLPVEARLLSGGEYVFLSFPSSSELYKVANKQLSAMSAGEDASAAQTALTPSRKGKGRGRGRRSAALPPEVESVLKNLPSGYKVGYGPDGSPRLIRTRVRRKKK